MADNLGNYRFCCSNCYRVIFSARIVNAQLEATILTKAEKTFAHVAKIRESSNADYEKAKKLRIWNIDLEEIANELKSGEIADFEALDVLNVCSTTFGELEIFALEIDSGTYNEGLINRALPKYFLHCYNDIYDKCLRPFDTIRPLTADNRPFPAAVKWIQMHDDRYWSTLNQNGP